MRGCPNRGGRRESSCTPGEPFLGRASSAAFIDRAALREFQASDGQAVPLRVPLRRGEIVDNRPSRSACRRLFAPAEASPRRQYRSRPDRAGPGTRPPDCSPGPAWEPCLARLARAGFRALGLADLPHRGPKEARPDDQGRATAPQASCSSTATFQRMLHQGRGVSYYDLIACRLLTAARAAGKSRSSKDYVMRDGDVVNSPQLNSR